MEKRFCENRLSWDANGVLNATNPKGNNVKTNIVPGKQLNRAFRVGLACSVAFGFAAGQMAFGAPLGDPLVPLGDASGFTLLVTDGGINSSDSAF